MKVYVGYGSVERDAVDRRETLKDVVLDEHGREEGGVSLGRATPYRG